MVSGTTGELSPIHRFAALGPPVDRHICAAYCDLLNLPVPEQFIDLINSHEVQRETPSPIKGSLEDGAKDRS
jgi:hypothetical protein